MKRKLAAVLFSVLFLLTAQPVSAGWSQYWRYEENGVIARSCWKYLNEDWYYFDGDGVMRTGWISDGGNWYYCEGNGQMRTGWLTLDDGIYYLNGSGAMVKGCTMTIDGRRYRFSASGRAVPLDSSEFFSEKFAGLSFEGKLAVLRELFPDGSYWNCGTAADQPNFISVTSVPCSHGKKLENYDTSRCNIYTGKAGEYLGFHTCIQCLGFASLVSDFLYGPDSAVEAFYDYADLQPGDHVRLVESMHSFIVLEKTDSYLTVLECNGDYQTCRIRWNRRISASQLKQNSEVVFLRRTGA